MNILRNRAEKNNAVKKMHSITRNSKKICIFVAVMMACIMLTACGAPENLTQEYAVGLWSAEYSEQGKAYVSSMALNDGGEYGLVVYIDGEFTAAEIGTYTMGEDCVTLYKSGDTAPTMIFDYSEGCLVNAGHKYKKQKTEDTAY